MKRVVSSLSELFLRLGAGRNSMLVVGFLVMSVGSVRSVQLLPPQVTRYEFAEALAQTVCTDCLVPDTTTQARYASGRLASQQQDPQKALDDIVFEKTSWGGKDYYYCVAYVVDAGRMVGYPRTTSPYCSGKFCGSSFLTTVELVEALTRLVGPNLRENYPISWTGVSLWAKTAKHISVEDHKHLAEALERCPKEPCPATSNDAFALWLRRCSTDLARCAFSPWGDFTATVSATPHLNILRQAGVFDENTPLGKRFDLVDRAVLTSILTRVHALAPCDQSRAQDYDADGIPNREDVCPYVYDPKQADMDGDGIGDVCDDDIDGDGIQNTIGIINAQGVLVPRLLSGNKDNCVTVPNPNQKNTGRDLFGDACGADAQSADRFLALQIDASPYQGSAPLQVTFTQKNIGLQEALIRDFGDGVSAQATQTTHIFTQPGIYTVKATAGSRKDGLVGMIPLHILPESRLQAGLEAISKDLVVSPDKTALLVQHISVGDIQHLTVRAGNYLKTITPKQEVSVPVASFGPTFIEMQAYNGSGQRVSLSQLSIDAGQGVGSQLHTSSLDPAKGTKVDITTLFAGFTQDDLYQVSWDFGDGVRQTGGLFASHTWQTPGVYVVKQTIQFRDSALRPHENILTILVRDEQIGKQMRLSVDALQKSTMEPFIFTVTPEHLAVESIGSCRWQFTPDHTKLIQRPKLADMRQSHAFIVPGSYAVVVMCQSTGGVWYTMALTVSVVQNNGCYTQQATGCDMDKDGIPDLCDDDIDGDGKKNFLYMLTKDLADCRISAENIQKDILLQSITAIAAGADFDNCPFTKNDDQADDQQDGIGNVCVKQLGPIALAPGAGGGTGDQGGGGGGSDVDSDGDGIPDKIDACPSTPESANGVGDADGCPEAPKNELTDPTVPQNPLVAVVSCTQCPCAEADYASSLRKGDRVRAMLVDPGGTIIYRYTAPEIIQENIPDIYVGGE